MLREHPDGHSAGILAIKVGHGRIVEKSQDPLIQRLIIAELRTFPQREKAWGIVGVPIVAEALAWLFILIIFIYPFAPINLYVRILGLIFSQSWPIFLILVLFDNIKDDISAFSIPLATVNFNFIIQI